jgi:serine phosphatase RsbU (regulator of sigma subunit)
MDIGRGSPLVDSWKTKRRGRLTLRRRLLVSVNVTLAVLLVAFLVYEYDRNLTARFAEKHAALRDEAAAVCEGVAQMRHHGRRVVQNYVDAVCRRMQESSSPGHHLVVETDGFVLQSQVHRHDLTEVVSAIHSADSEPTHQAFFGKKEIVVGSAERDGARVFVSEYVDDIRQSVAAEIVRHLLVLGAGGVIAAVIVNLVLYRTVDKPLRRLVRTVTQIGQGQLGLQSKPFSSAELACLSDAINSMSSSLAETEQKRNAQMQKARRIQEHLLPRDTAVPGLRLTTLYRPADEVSGDYYDVFRLPDNAWLVCIADVVGHGIPAAMTAAILKALLLEATRNNSDPATVLGHVNERLSEVVLPGDFASMCLARWRPGTSQIEYASAGHGSIQLISRDGGARELLSTGLLLGVDPDASWRTVEVSIAPGDRLVLATDGVSETMNSSRELFGNRRLTDLLSEHGDSSLVDQVSLVEDALSHHREGTTQHDDITLILVEFEEASGKTPETAVNNVIG